MLTSLSINHFKSIESAEIHFGKITVFVGINGSGKTNVIDALRFLRDASQNGLDRAFSDRHGVESVRQWSPTRPYQISLTATIDEDQFWSRYSLSIDSARGQFQVSREDLDYREISEFFPNDADASEPYLACQRKLARRDRKGAIHLTEFDKEIDSDEFDTIAGTLSNTSLWNNVKAESTINKFDRPDELSLNFRPWEYRPLRSRLTNFQAYSIYPNTLRIPQEPSNETFLLPEGRNLSSVFKRMRKSKRGQDAIAQIIEAMKAIIPNLEQISILSVGGYLVPQFHIQEHSGKRHIFNVSQMSDGTLRVLGLLTALYQEPRPAIIALEEPEQTVNPGILVILADAIKEVGRTNQIIVTTHSPNLLDQFSADQIRTVELHNGLTKVAAVSSTQMSAVQDRLFTLGELMVSEGLHG
jgi:predicted ATPase